MSLSPLAPVSSSSSSSRLVFGPPQTPSPPPFEEERPTFAPGIVFRLQINNYIVLKSWAPGLRASLARPPRPISGVKPEKLGGEEGWGAGNGCRGRGGTRVKKTLPIICCTNARAKLLVFNLASPRVIGWKWGEKKGEKMIFSLYFSSSSPLFLFSSSKYFTEWNDERERQKINPLSLNYISPPLSDLGRYIRPVGFKYISSDKSNLSIQRIERKRERERKRKIGRKYRSRRQNW